MTTTISLKSIDAGFDPRANYGYYPASRTARPLTEAEEARVANIESLILAAPDNLGWAAKSARESIESARAVATGKRVSRQWCTHDPVGDLIDRAERAANHIALAIRPGLPADADESMPGIRVERIGQAVYLRHDDYRGTIRIADSDPRYPDLFAAATTI